MKNFHLVQQFQSAFNCNIGTTPSFPDNKERALRLRLLIEEYDELLEAEDADDFIEVCDAIGDLKYIINGTLVSYGAEYVAINNAVHVGGIPAFPTHHTRRSLVQCVKQIVDNIRVAEFDNLYITVVIMLSTLDTILDNMSIAYGIPIQEIFEEIHASNMSKLDDNGEPIFREDGKVLKSHNFFQPKIEEILIKHGWVK